MTDFLETKIKPSTPRRRHDMNLEDAVEYVRTHFFPRWDKKRVWTIEESSFDQIHGVFGMCEGG